jgi:nucleoside-diphosphate-sugar epimerase
MISKKKILILGAMGKVGSKIFKSLKKKNYNVIGLSHQYSLDPLIIKTDYLKINKQVKFFLSSSDIIINCIGEHVDLKKMLYKNYQILKKIIKNLNKKKKITFIHLSTCGVYGNSKFSGINEEVIPRPITYYAKTKYQGEIFLKKKLKRNKILVILRPSQIIGRDLENTSVKKLDFLIKKKIFFYFSNKKSIYSYIFFDDLLKFIEKLIKKKNSSSTVFNISNNSTYEQIVKALCDYYLIKNSYFSLNRKISKVLFYLLISILKIRNFFFKYTSKISISTFEILTTNKIFISNKIKEYLNSYKLKKINKNNLNILLKN